MNLAILGARVFVDAAQRQLLRRLRRRKQQNGLRHWSPSLNQSCAPLIGLLCVRGGFGFACAVASGKIGRVFVNPVYAQTNVPMPGFGMSPSLKNAAEWWIKFISLAPAVKLSVEKHWRNSLGLDRCWWRRRWFGCCGMFTGNWYYTALVVPGSVTSQLFAPR